VHAFWQAGVDAGHRDDGAPGPRPEYGPDYYGGFLRDPDGNSAEAIHSERANPVQPGRIDHLWIRVADLPVVLFDHLRHAGDERCIPDEAWVSVPRWRARRACAWPPMSGALPIVGTLSVLVDRSQFSSGASAVMASTSSGVSEM